jgi:hypothetical protein
MRTKMCITLAKVILQQGCSTPDTTMPLGRAPSVDLPPHALGSSGPWWCSLTIVLVIRGLVQGSPTLRILFFVDRDFDMRHKLVDIQVMHLYKSITARINAIGLAAASFIQFKGEFEFDAKLSHPSAEHA